MCTSLDKRIKTREKERFLIEILIMSHTNACVCKRENHTNASTSHHTLFWREQKNTTMLCVASTKRP